MLSLSFFEFVDFQLKYSQSQMFETHHINVFFVNKFHRIIKNSLKAISVEKLVQGNTMILLPEKQLGGHVEIDDRYFSVDNLKMEMRPVHG